MSSYGISLDFNNNYDILNKAVINIFENYYILQNVSESSALLNLQNKENNSWIFRFDYITQNYYLTIKNDDEFINHRIYYYNKKNDIVYTKKRSYDSLEDYLKYMQKIYNLDLTKQIIV